MPEGHWRFYRTRSFRIWAGAAAGVFGLAILIAADRIIDAMTVTGTIRYAPADGTDRMVAATKAATPTVGGLRSAFERAGYKLDSVRKSGQGVPRLRLASLPRDLPDISDASDRKRIFLSLALPLVLEANRRVAGQRSRLIYLADGIRSGRAPAAGQQDWLARLAERYGVRPDRIDRLLRRVDGVPPSLALAQAATESGWGTSRFAMQGNAVFGQWTSASGEGLVPTERPQGRDYKVRSFDRLIDSFDAYLLNLNTHRAYRDFRAMRAEMRLNGKPLDGMALAGTLLAYSERGQEYVDLLRGIIRVNELAPLDAARLNELVIGFEAGT